MGGRGGHQGKARALGQEGKSPRWAVGCAGSGHQGDRTRNKKLESHHRDHLRNT